MYIHNTVYFVPLFIVTASVLSGVASVGEPGVPSVSVQMEGSYGEQQ